MNLQSKDYPEDLSGYTGYQQRKTRKVDFFELLYIIIDI